MASPVSVMTRDAVMLVGFSALEEERVLAMVASAS